MRTTSLFLFAFFPLLLLNGCSAADKENLSSSSSGFDPTLNGTSSSNEITSGSNIVTNSSQVKTGNGNKEDPVNESIVGVNNKSGIDKNNTTRQSGLKEGEGDNLEKGNEHSKGKEVNSDRKDTSSDGVQSRDLPKERGGNDDSGQSSKAGTRVDECDSSNKCMDQKKQFVACLRVPGNDSPDLSLLIQNKVKGPLTVRISAPDNVGLEKTKLQLPENEDNEVRVSVRGKGSDNLITIKAGKGNCSLDFRDLISHNSGEEFIYSDKSPYIKVLSQKPAIALISFAALLILASGCMCVILRRRQLSSGTSKYQRLDMELPVASAGKSESDSNHGWENSWDDDWDDEEAPKTPSLPVTPSLSSKGLASRRLNKEGWKD